MQLFHLPLEIVEIIVRDAVILGTLAEIVNLRLISSKAIQPQLPSSNLETSQNSSTLRQFIISRESVSWI